MDELIGTYKGKVAWNHHYDYSHKKIILVYRGEIQAMKDKYPRTLLKLIVWDIGVSAFLIRLVVHENISYLSNKRNYEFLSLAIEDKRKDHVNKLKRSHKLNILCFFSDDELAEQQDVSILIKTKHIVDIMMFGLVKTDFDIMPPFIFQHGLRLNTEPYVKRLELIVLT